MPGMQRKRGGAAMNDHVHLIGAEQVQSAANTMRQAAADMSSAANTIDFALQHHRQFMEDWLARFVSALEAQR